MTGIRNYHRLVQSVLGTSGLAASLALGACMDLTNVPNYDNESLDGLVNDPTPARIATAAQGVQVATRASLVGVFGFIADMSFKGREGYTLDPATPGLVPENLVGPLDPALRSFWAEGYRAIKLGNIILTALDKVTGLTDPEKEATRGFVKTLQAHAFTQIILAHDQSGAVIAVDQDPSLGNTASIADRTAVYAHISQLLDQANSHLTSAGSPGRFPFTLSPGYAGFTTPSTFRQFNRALKARVEVYRASLEKNLTYYNSALTALTQSFISTTQPLTLGVYHSYSTNSGDESNTSFDPTGRAILGHPSFETDAQLRADGTKDLRFTTKTFKRATPNTQSGVTSDIGLRVYPSNAAPVPIIRNEDLILLRAEANLAVGNRAAALQDINFVRTTSGGLANIPDPGDPGLMDELIYNRRYSLFQEGGHRWFDMRRWGRLAQLPRDLPSHRIFSRLPLPLAECNARSPAPPGCDRDNGI